MDNAPITLTSLALIVLLVLMFVMLACHYLGPRNHASTTWMRSNKEEKIGLSKNKLFHANGYMIHHSGSEFLLSTSGSFKRFDTIDKDDHNNHSSGGVGGGSQHNNAQQTTTPLWNLPQVDSNIPPQPLRPAPAPTPPIPPSSASHSKTVSFSFSKLNETTFAYINGEEYGGVNMAHPLSAHESIKRTTNGGSPLVSCMRSNSTKTMVTPKTVPQPIDAPPPTRLYASSSSAAMLSGTAIPRPQAKRQISLQNGVSKELSKEIASLNPNVTTATAIISSHKSDRPQSKQLTRRNSSTNPFLCEESLESLTEKIEHNTALLTRKNINSNNDRNQLKITTSADIESLITETINSPTTPAQIGSTANIQTNGNPFYEDPTITSSPDELNLLVLTDEDDSGSAGEHQITHTNESKNQSKIFTFHKTTDSTENAFKPTLQNQQFRNRSFSETEASDTELHKLSSRITAGAEGILKMSSGGGGLSTNPFSGLAQKVKGPHMLQKTISEDYLFRKLGMSQSGVHAQHTNGVSSVGNGTWSFGRSLLRQDSSFSLGRRNSSQCSLDSATGAVGSMDSINLERAISCDSVNSDSSVLLSDLDQTYTQITGYLCVGLQYDKNSITDSGMELTVSILEAKGLLCPFSVESLDTFVRIYLVPDQAGAMQTKVFRASQTPSYNESFNFWLKRQQRNKRHSLWFHLYHNGVAHTLIGEAEMEIGEVPRPITTWIPLSDSRKCNAQWGEVMFSLSYLPTAERLTVVIVKARNLKLDLTTNESMSAEIQNVFVKVYLMNNEKKFLKKRTSLKRKDRCPIFNESMIFSLPPQSLTTVQLRLTVFAVINSASILPLGHVIAGSCATGKGLRHWHQMLSSLRKPVAMWHVLRRATNQPIFTGGAEAVVAALQSTALRSKRNSII